MVSSSPLPALQCGHLVPEAFQRLFRFRDHCKSIFDHEPEKYVQSWLPVHQIYQGNCFPEGTDPTVEGFDPLAAVLKYYNLEHGRDNLDFDISEDKKNFAEWRGQATKNI